MNFNDQIKPLAERVTRLKDNINSKEVGETYLLLFILEVLGYHVRLVSCMATWLICLSCAPKHQFYFTPSSYDQKGQFNNLAFSTHQPQAILSHDGTLADSVSFTPTAPNAEELSTYAPSQALSMAARAKLTPADKAMHFTRQTVLVTKLARTINTKGVVPSADKPPIHKLAWLSALFSLISLALLFINIQSAVLLMLLSILAAVITGRIAIDKIKKEPNRFSGKRLAQAAVIVVLVMLVTITAYFILASS